MSGFVRMIGKDQLLALARKIKPDLPLSVAMYNHLVMHATSQKSTPTYVLSNNPDSHAVMWLIKEHNTYAGFFCRQQEVNQLTKALRETPLLDWSKFLMFYHVPDYLVGPLKKVAEDLGNNNPLRSWQSYTFTYQRHRDNEPLRCDAGFRVCRLGKNGLKNLIERSRYVKDNPVEIKWHSEYKVPAVGVYLDPSVTGSTLIDVDNLPYAEDEQVPVSWITTTMQGSLGRLETHKDYRKRGLGTLTTRVLTRLQVNQGYIPHSRLSTYNSASLAMIQRMPEWIYTHNESRMAPAYYEFP